MKKILSCICVVTMIVATGCSGTRTTGNSFTTHAESIRIFGYAIPDDDQKSAMALVPKGATIETVDSTPADWSSVVGFIGNLFWVHFTQVGGTLPPGHSDSK